MIFNTYWFVVFCIVFFPVYWLLARPFGRRIWLLGGCVVFHSWFAGPAGVIPIFLLGLLTYGAALSRSRLACSAMITLCAAALLFYKYTHFISIELLGWINSPWADALRISTEQLLPAAPPLAISFFVFEFVHYLVEVRRGEKPIKSPLSFALFALHFPSLVAGPIKRYQSYVEELDHGVKSVTVDDVAAGIQRFAWGVVKKIVIADNLTLMLGYHESQFEVLSPFQSWLFLAGLSARILLDFSGYTDMALGLSRMMGIKLPENFNWPYLACNSRDFWQRWHMSLSSWIRDYIYIPLGGNRRGPLRRMLYALFAFALCGLWHGPAWHFVLWGLWHGCGLLISSSYPTLMGPLGRKLATVFQAAPVLGWALTLLHVSFGWLLFFYDPSRAWNMALQLIGLT
ncbi:MAG: MBOAT family protein [Opitutaceae bacterium]|nr:MBOAT family protein [Cephaloticoccus sp.]MCP5531063.1 MBOAT family protein [Opitutaceae bacterium]